MSNINYDSVFVVSGGGHGITAQCVIKLAQVCPCSFILLGRSSLKNEPAWAKNITDEIELKKQAFSALNYQDKKPKPVEVNQLIKSIFAIREIQKTLQTIKQLGGQAEYLSCDITDHVNLRQTLAPIVDKFGQITGIIHGAGVLADKLIENKTEQDFEVVYSTKIEGLQNLLSCVNPDQLKHLVLFSSAAGFYGNIGQSDYAISNEILNKFAHQFKHENRNCQVTSFNWGPWESGMVTPELKQVFAERGIEVIPVEVGTRIFVNQLIKGNSETVQILVGSELVNPSVFLESDLKSYQIKRKLTLEANPFLQDHVIGNHPVLPAIFAVVWLANSAEELYPGYSFVSCENYQVLKGIVFDATLADEYILDVKEIQKIEQQEIELSAKIWSKTKEGKYRYHYQGNLKLLKQIPNSPIYENFDKHQDNQLIKLSPYQDGTLFHTGNFQGVKRIINITSKKITMECVVTKVEENYWGQFPFQSFNPLAADIPFQCMLIWVRRFYQAGSLPTKCQKVEHFQNIPFNSEKTLYVSMEVQSSSETKLVANIISHDEEGNIYSRVFGSEVTISKQLNHLFTPGNINNKETENLISFWHKFLGVRHPICALSTALYKRFVGKIIIEDEQDFHALNHKPRLYLANHQVGIESILFVFAVSALSNSVINTVAKFEHQQSWVNELSKQIYAYPQIKDPELIFYFDRNNQGSMLNLLKSTKEVIQQQQRSLLVHVQGTRALTCRQPVNDLSSVFIDLALELNLPIIPVKFVGGLPVEPLETRIEFPFRYTCQNYHLGKAIFPENLKTLGNLERKTLILEKLNQLGETPDQSFPNLPDTNFEKEVQLWIKQTGVSQVCAVLYKVLETIPNPPDEIRTLLAGIRKGNFHVSHTPEDHWLEKFGKWLSGY